MADTKPRDIKHTFIDMGMAIQLEQRKPRLISQLRNLGIHCRDWHLSEVLRRPGMTESLAMQLTKAVSAIIEYQGRKCPRPAKRPPKHHIKQY